MSAFNARQNRKAFYQQSIEEVLAALKADAQRGLQETEVQARLAKYGRNELVTEKPVPRWRKFLAQFQNVLIILLLVATAISAGLWFYERESPLPYEAMAIFAVVLHRREPAGIKACPAHPQRSRTRGSLLQRYRKACQRL